MKLVVRGNFDRRSTERGGNTVDLLITRCSGSLFALPVSEVAHVLRFEEVDRSPVQTAYPPLVAFLDWNGTEVPLVSLKEHLEWASADPSKRPSTVSLPEGGCVVLLKLGTKGLCGLLVDDAEQIAHCNQGELRAFPVAVLDTPRRLYRESLVSPQGLIFTLDAAALFPSALTSFLTEAAAEFGKVRGATSPRTEAANV